MIWYRDADCIFVPSQISSTARYLIFDVSRCPGALIPFFGHNLIYVLYGVHKGALEGLRSLAYVRL
jgi:hypothetical protein